MSDTSNALSPRVRSEARPSIHLPDGEVLEPRANFAAEMGVCDKTAARMDLPTTYVGGVAYVARTASLKIVAERVRRRNHPPQRRRTRGGG
jgi:hypothetical protein